MSKLTLTAARALVSTQAEEIARLLAKVDTLEAEIRDLKAPKTETKTETMGSNLVTIRPEIHVQAFRKALAIVDFKASVSDEFIANWSVLTNGEGNWVALVPKVSNRETNRFVSEFGRARASKGIVGNIYKNTGIWFHPPVK